jgi:Co/Zn/Cd efflux system component
MHPTAIPTRTKEAQHDYSHIHERKTTMVIYLASLTMILEISHKQGDHNIRAAYLHVLADEHTSLTAIIALLAVCFIILILCML